MRSELTTSEIVAKLHELHRKVPVHVSARELADELNVHPNSVRHWIQRAELSGLVRCVVETPERRYVPADVHV
jgi:predicted ArsR family transcriptional regulator